MNLKRTLLFFLILFYSVELAQAGDEGKINQMLERAKPGDTVQLEGITYTIESPIMMKSGVTLLGVEGKTKIFLAATRNWGEFVPVLDGYNLEGCRVAYIIFDMNSDNQKVKHGKGFHNAIHWKNSNNLEVDHCTFINGKGDGARFKYCSNVRFHDNLAYRLGHDAFYAIDSKNVEAWNNRITTRTNSALRLWNTEGARLYNNTIDAQLDSLGGNPGIQIEFSKYIENPDTEVINNILYKTWGSGIWLIAYDQGNKITKGVVIKNNLFKEAAQSYNIGYAAGVTINGFKGAEILSNVADGVLNSFVLVLSGGDGTIIKDNIITGTQEHAGIYQAGTGSGIVNRAGASLTVDSNNFFDNPAGDTYRTEATNSDKQDPKNHKTSSGWWWTSEGWESEWIKPSDLGSIESYSSGKETDTDTHEVIFDDIFDILKITFSTTGTTNQTEEDIHYTIQKTESGRIAGGIKIIGFKDLINIDGVPYIPDNDSVLVKYEAVKAPSYSWNNAGVSRIKKDVDIKIENGNATATLTVKMEWYKLSTNSTGATKKKYKNSEAVFSDTVKAPQVLNRPSELEGILYEYPIHSLAYVPSDGLTQVEYDYDGKKVKHIYLIGEQHRNENGMIYTNFSQVNYWKGDLYHQGEFLFINGSFDPEKLTVTAYTPYESFQVTRFDYVKKDYPDKFYADWLFPSFGLFLILGFGAWYYIRKILY